MRAAATSALAQYPEAQGTLLALAGDGTAEVRAAAGAALLGVAEDAAAWAAIDRLAREDATLLVRERMADALAADRSIPHEAISARGSCGSSRAATRLVLRSRPRGASAPAGTTRPWRF